NGTTTLFAALNVLTGEVTGRCFDRHRHEEFLRFLKVISMPRYPPGPGYPRDLGQLQYPRARRREPLAAAAQAVPAALHHDLLVLAEPGRTVVPRPGRQGAYAAAASTRCPA